MKHNVGQINDCYGCGVCAASCPRKIISIVLNKDGFYEPRIANSKDCVECGICMDICSFQYKDCELEERYIEAWAAWSNDEDVRRKCSSGGVAFAIGRQLINEGYKVAGCRYNVDKQIAEHYIASTMDELIQSTGSKYIQSYTVDAFRKIKRRGEKYLVTGTPCQIDSFRRMIRKFKCEDNFVLMDFFCHSVPSMLAWKAYIKMLEPKIGAVTYASWRNKFDYGWHDSWNMGMDGEKTSKPVNWHDSYNLLIREKKTFIQSRWSQGDWFYNMFLGDYCVGKHCQNHCKYKYDKSSADIRIGDLWGDTYKDDEKGVSALVAFTDKGREVVNSLSGVTLINHPFGIVAEGQMKKNVVAHRQHKLVMTLLRHRVNISPRCWNILLFTENLPYRIIHKIKRLIR